MLDAAWSEIKFELHVKGETRTETVDLRCRTTQHYKAEYFGMDQRREVTGWTNNRTIAYRHYNMLSLYRLENASEAEGAALAAGEEVDHRPRLSDRG